MDVKRLLHYIMMLKEAQAVSFVIIIINQKTFFSLEGKMQIPT